VLAYTAAALTPDLATTWVLSRRVSWARSMDLLLTNRVLTGEEAAAWGLVSRAVPRQDLAAEVDAVVATLRGGASTALVGAKRLVAEAAGRTLAEQLDDELVTVRAAAVSADGVEGIDAFLAKRPPVFG
jgi:2-(1,2-epoxy-1,2-dihydrophenyl)acetyl-CoA isomerase